MACCQPGACCSPQMEAAESALRCFENLPLIGHAMAAVYGCCKDKDRAERAAIKATIGIILSVFNFGAEAADEASRRRHLKARSFTLSDRRDWMREFPRLSMDQLCLPGSHQSGTARMHKKLSPIPMCEGWSRCQGLSITQQLEGGVRFLDLRVMSYGGDIWLHHNVVICEKLQDVMQAVQKFVESNTSEVVGVYITNNGKEVDWGKVHQIITETVGSRLLFEHDRRRPIGDVARDNKNVAIFGVPNVAYAWHCLDNRWPNKSWPDELADDLQQHIQSMAGRNSPNMFWYKAECTPNAPMVVRILGGIQGLVAKKCAKGKFAFIEDLAAAVNYEILQVLERNPQLPFNVFSTDFVHDEIIEKTIRCNMNTVAPSAMMTSAAAPEDDDVNHTGVQGVKTHSRDSLQGEQHDSTFNAVPQAETDKPMQMWVSNV